MYRKTMPNFGCNTAEIVARSIKSDCNIQFWDIMFNYTYISIESSFFTIGAPCNQSAFAIKYINSEHDHCEPDYTFTLKMDYIKKEDFFKPGSIKITELFLFEEKLCGGVGGPISNVDITLIWDEVLLVGNVYSGKGRFVIHKDIPSSFPNYTYPAQEISFEFKPRERTAH
ncbi:MAG: hypothetical protein WAO52_02440 [Prolixibacteraceae bacterium]